MSILRVIGAILVVLGGHACFGCSPALPEQDVRFLNASPKARREQLQSAPPAEAVRLYVLQARRIRPFDLGAREVVAKRGPELLNELVARLGSSVDEADIMALSEAVIRCEELYPGLVKADDASRDAARAGIDRLKAGPMREVLDERFRAVFGRGHEMR